jgi:arsenate reductase
MQPRRVIFVCSHNSARSQMAEGMLRSWGGDAFEVHSAGIEAGGLRPEAIEVMDEIGIDISEQRSKTLDQYVAQPFDWVITVCDTARDNCPVFPGAADSAHWGVDDPSEVTGDHAERVAAFRRARDDLRTRIHMFMLAAGRQDLRAPTG